jgi:hypothetical protein
VTSMSLIWTPLRVGTGGYGHVRGRSGARGAARALPGRIVAKVRRRLPADRRTIHVLADHFLELADAELFALLAAHLNEKVDDPLVVALMGRPARSSGLYRLQKVIYHVAHVSIIGDRSARLQVMRGHMLARTLRNNDSFT